MRIGGVPTDAKVDYVTLHLLEGEARTWYDLRVKNVSTESFDSFADALKTHFTNHNSQRHYREALQHLHMRQFKDVMQYNQAFRQMMLCLEDMSDLDKLTHYERGLEPKYRNAVRQARCADIASAMAEVDIVADAHDFHVVLPDNIANIPASAPNQTTPHMGVEPMQISLIRNKNERKNQSRIQNGPRQGRSDGPSSSEVICFNCGRRGHYARRCKLIKRVQVSMLLSPLMLTGQESLSQPATLSTITNDDDKVNARSFEGAVHTAI